MARGRTPGTPARARFLATLARTANVSAAAADAGMSRRGAYGLRRTDPAWAADWDDAVGVGLDALEAAMRSRAIEGVPRHLANGAGLVLWPDGSPVVERHYDDDAAWRLLASYRPAYR